MDLPSVPDPRELIPPSGIVQERLAEAIRAERTLRQLLRVAVRAERDQELREQQQGGPTHAA
jgi:hypothetical protein